MSSPVSLAGDETTIRLPHRTSQSSGCPGECGDAWIVDVNGVLQMIDSLHTGDLDGDVPNGAVRAEIRRMVESIHFER